VNKQLQNQILDHGMTAITNMQLLELLLSYAMPEQDTALVAHDLMEHFQSFRAVVEAEISHLCWIKRMNPETAILMQLIIELERRYQLESHRQRPTLGTAQKIAEYTAPLFYGSKYRTIYLLCLDACRRVMRSDKIAVGSVNHVSLTYRRTAEIAVLHNAVEVVLVQTRPGGKAIPSDADKQTHLRLRETLSPLMIPVFDHLIIGENCFYSFAEANSTA